MADSSKRGWRRGASGAAGGAAGGAGGKGWQSRRTTATQTSATSHLAKLVALGVVLIALATYFAMKVFFIPVKTPLAVISVTQFAAPIPPNGYAQEDALILARVNLENIHKPPVPDSNLTREAFLKFVDESLASRGGGPDKNVLLVALSTHGVVNERGEACLLLSDSAPWDSSSWLPFREITDRVKRASKLHVVLFLDAGRIDNAWSLGILRNDFVARLEHELTSAELPNLHVFSSVSNGQRSWTAPELGTTVFGHFLALGLQTGGKGASDQITLRELVEFVTSEVSAWVRARRAGTQTPKLLTKSARDVALAYRAGAKDDLSVSNAAGEKQRLQGSWDRLNESWRLFEERSRERKWPRLEPVVTAAIQRSLLRGEALLWSGTAYRGELEALQTSIRTQLETQPAANLPAELTGYSLAWERLLGVGTDQATANSVAANEKLVLDRWVAAGGAPKPKEGEPPLPRLARGSAERVAWQFLRRSPLPARLAWRESLSLIDSATEEVSPARVGESAEILFLRMVDRHLDLAPDSADFSATTRAGLEQALAIRELAERAAVPVDERVHYWVQSGVNQADAGRRIVEDRLFCDSGLPAAAAGSSSASRPTTSEKEDRSAAEILSTYEAAERQGGAIVESLTLRDEVWGQLPYLAEWLLHADRPTRQLVVGGQADIAATAGVISQIAKLNHELAATIDRSLTEGKFDGAAVASATESVRTEWGRLRGALVSHGEELKVRAGEDRPTWREIDDVLRVPSPLLVADERNRLALKYLNILFSEPNAAATTARTGAKIPDVVEEVTAADWDPVLRHPVLDLLRRDELTLLLKERAPIAEPTDGAGAEQRLAIQGGTVRRLFTNLAAAARELEDVTNRRLEEATETPGNLRAGISEADRLCRAAIPLAGAPVPDPAHRLRRLDLHLAMLWHAARTLDDFWGPSPTSGLKGDDAGKPSYFALVAKQYLQLATRLDDTPKSLLYGGVDLQRELADREAAVGAVQLEAGDIQTLGGDTGAPQRVRVGWPPAMAAPGVAGLFVSVAARDADPRGLTTRDQESHRWRRRPMGVAASGAVEIQQRLDLDTNLGPEAQFVASLMYRGHVWRQPFAVRRPTAVLTTTVAPRLPPQAKVKVTGAGTRRAYITFIFDCSRSMEQDGRMAKAKEGFRQVLEALPKDRRYEIGLRVYGRRAGFNSDGTRTFDQNGQPTDRDPNTDEELLVPVAPFVEDQYETVLERIAELRPLGVTPLYLAIKEALGSKDFERSRPGDLRHIIVLTDGINEIFPRNVDSDPKETTATAVLQTIRAGNPAGDVRLDVVLFQKESLRRDAGLQQRLAARSTTLEQELADIQSVATATGGEFYSAENPAALVEALRRALKLVKYSVTPSGSPGTPEPLELDQDWPITGLSGQPRNFLVQLHGADRPATQTIVLEGGESVGLQYDKSEDKLVFPPFEPGDAREPLDGLIEPTSKETYRVLPILPRKNLRQVEFGLAIQNRDRLKFTTRPRHVWAEIQPLTDSEQPVGPAYPFSDTRFAVDTPVPVLQFTITDWPPGATKAALRAWIKFDFPPLKPNGTAAIEELRTVTVEEDIPQVAFQASIQQVGEGKEGWRLRVTERHEPGSNLFSARVQASPPPDQLRHRYFVGVDTIEHEFDYLEKPAPTVIVTSRERITENGLVVPRVVMAVRD